ncbi:MULTISPECIES: hypothetical protein [Stenotrophomonas]|jgi:hypothetical protein|uniref:Uncharacterized protein n=1 Tax=Stenotrophomonas maltophilia TaxID=40324 RepID=A0A4S2CRK8_STEMA|nr:MULTISPECIES: hypothetical protein [Stenotrophomonas]MBD3828524.1 hypothetical protein [Stenotrophomonas sp.]QIO88405.1 hypothetical protein G9274_002090 [Stenotrophomonas rhizophila]TGY31116.1 hypothetical protein E5352_19105 [Stenotrophomonas maltophilia]
MDFYGFDRAKAVANCDSLNLGLARDTDSVRAWNRLRPEHIVELLHGAAADARQDARNLAAQISRGSWRIYMQAPAQGKANQLVSNAREVAVSAGGRDYRLQLNEGTKLQLERITQSA